MCKCKNYCEWCTINNSLYNNIAYIAIFLNLTKSQTLHLHEKGGAQ